MPSTRFPIFFCLLFTFGAGIATGAETPRADGDPGIKKLRDIVIYRDDKFYRSFPSIVRRRGGELLVAFRRAPDRRRFGETRVTHTDPNSYLELVRSTDSGKTWTSTP